MMNIPDSAVKPPHVSVLYHQIITALRPESPGLYVDATIGAGGHAWGILEKSSPYGQLLGLDTDPQALALSHQRLTLYNHRFHLLHSSYTGLRNALLTLGWDHTDGIVIDLGVSSMQIDSPERGFSFQHDGPLDMRFDPSQPVSAETLVNHSTESELAEMIWRYGEERNSRRIARAIVGNRPFDSTLQLASLIKKISRSRPQDIHPATRTFQALRIAVNRELDGLEEFLPQAIDSLSSGGRIAVISFHSLEDRIVKQFFRRESRDCICPADQPICNCGHHASIIEVNRRPITPDEEEINNNTRARSAKLRIAEKK
jgi:16S rRNA (cytosine1402-N4)-methyltransferase